MEINLSLEVGGSMRGCSFLCRIAMLLCLEIGVVFWHLLKWFLLLYR